MERRKLMGRLRSTPRIVVEECEIVKATDLLICLRLFRSIWCRLAEGDGGLCLLCPRCGRRAFKLYRPLHLQEFACRGCHNLSYNSVQRHDAHLYGLLKVPESDLVEQDENMTWKLLAIRAGYIRLGLIRKY